eukprot:5481001-Heterocapsa_arctica.AAC.1
MVLDHAGKWVWRTSLAAEYPQGLCEALAAGHRDALLTEPERSEVLRSTFTLQGGQDAVEPTARKEQREEENQRCIGGLRNPHTSVDQVPGWKHVGLKLRKVLNEFVARHEEVFVQAMSTLGDKEGKTIPDTLLPELRAVVAEAIGTQ